MDLSHAVLVVTALLLAAPGCSSAENEEQERLDARKLDDARNTAVKLAGDTEIYTIQKRGKCPADLAALKAAGITTSTRPDPWGTAYKIVCEAGTVTGVMSAGPDGKWDTDDDIRSW